MTPTLKAINKEIKRLKARYAKLEKLLFANHFAEMCEISKQFKENQSKMARLRSQALIDMADKNLSLLEKRSKLFEKAKHQHKNEDKWMKEMGEINFALQSLNSSKFREMPLR